MTFLILIISVISGCGSGSGNGNGVKSNSNDADSQSKSVFIETYGYGTAYYAQETSDGGFILAGSRGHDSSGDLDPALIMCMRSSINATEILLVKTDSAGRQLWSKTFSANYKNNAKLVRETADGGFLIVGFTGSLFDYDPFIIKTDSEGNEQWSKTFNTNLVDIILSETIDSGYIISGHALDPDNNIYILKLDAAGNEIWSNIAGSYGNENFSSIQETADGGFILAGKVYQTDNIAMYLVKTDSNGNKLWSKTFGSGDENKTYSVKETSDKGFILAGYAYNYITNDARMYIVKTDADGNELWHKDFGATEYLGARAVQETSDGGFILVGHNPLAIGGYVIYLIKTDSNGNELWSRTYSGQAGAQSYFVKEMSAGGYIIVGNEFISTPCGYSSRMLLIKTDEQGNYTQ